MAHNKVNDAVFPASKYHSRRTPSVSSSSSSSSSSFVSIYFPEDSPPSTPATPLRFSGIPFSWEHLPGIPKNKLHSHKKNESRNLLPPPPTAATPSSKSRHHLASASQTFRRDPFFAAFVECSKDGEDRDHQSDAEYRNVGPKVGRSISDRFGLVNMTASCKNTCAVSESLVYLPRPRRRAYGLITHRSR